MCSTVNTHVLLSWEDRGTKNKSISEKTPERVYNYQAILEWPQ